MTTTKRDGFVRYIRRTAAAVLNEQNVTLARVRTSKRLLDQYWESFFDAHSEIAATTADDEAAQVQDDVLFGTQEIFQEAITFIEEKLIELELNEEVVVTPQRQQAPRRDELKLEKVRIEPFNGDVTLWPAFRDTFTALVHGKEHMDDAYKLYHLNASIGPNVKHVLQGFSMNAESYQGVWRELLARK